MSGTNLYVALALALGIGLMIGIERGWATRNAAAGSRVAGLRTFALLGLTGGVIGVLTAGPLLWVGVAAAAALCAMLVFGYQRQQRVDPTNVSVTGSLVAVLTMLLGLLATTGHPGAAVAMGGATTFLLSQRAALHRWVAGLADADIKAAAQYAVIACVILPVLPNASFGPYNAWNPRTLWLVVVFVTGLSFAGYLAARRLGPTRGTVAAAAIGATYSSTAVSVELARRLRKSSESHDVLRAGIAAATAVMPLRVLVLVAVLVPDALRWFAIGIAPAALVSGLYAIWLARGARKSPAPALANRNPFDFWPALGFAVLVALVIVVSRWSIDVFGARGVRTLVALTGLYDVDAAIITVGNMPAGTGTPRWLGAVLLMPILINNGWKAILVAVLGGWSEGPRAAIPLITSAVLIGASLVLLG